MFLSDFILNLNPVLGIAAKVVLILIITIGLNIIQKKMIPKAIIATIPKTRKESQDHLAARSKTMTYAITKVFTAVIWIIAIVMILGVIKVDTAPLLATFGLAGLGFGFAIQKSYS